LKLKLIRPPLGVCINSTIGELFINEVFLGYTLELPWRDNQHNISCVPEGTYPIQMFPAEHWHRSVPVVMNVPNRSGIEMHVANYAKDVLGCIGFGFTKAPDFIGDSINAIEILYRNISAALGVKEEVTIEIKRERL
jgi:hypothetical protein